MCAHRARVLGHAVCILPATYELRPEWIRGTEIRLSVVLCVSKGTVRSQMRRHGTFRGTDPMFATDNRWSCVTALSPFFPHLRPVAPAQVLSQKPRALILSVDPAPALALPGVVDYVDHKACS